MKFHLLVGICCLAIQCDASPWGFFNRFLTTPAPADYHDPTVCEGKNRKWSFCTGGRHSTRKTVDSCTQITEECSRGTKVASHFMHSALAPDNQIAPTRCRRFTHDFEYVEEDETNHFLNRRSVGENSTSSQTDEDFFVDLSDLGVGLGRSWVDSAVEGCRRRKRRSTTGPIKRDIAILMDESGSVGKDKFKLVKRIASAYVKLLCGPQAVHPSQTRIALTSFDQEIHHYKNLIDSNDKLNENADYLAVFIDYHINFTSETSGSTCLVRALDYIRGTVLNSNGARRGEENVVQEVLILTDACQNCNGNQVSDAARRLREANIDVYVVGVGLGRICQEKIKILAEGGKCFHFFNIVSWQDDLLEFIKFMENPPQCLTQLYSGNQNCETTTVTTY